MAQCAAKGFMISLLSFSKWLLALVITIILVPKFNPMGTRLYRIKIYC